MNTDEGAPKLEDIWETMTSTEGDADHYTTYIDSYNTVDPQTGKALCDRYRITLPDGQAHWYDAGDMEAFVRAHSDLAHTVLPIPS